jgi:hypothetical protein
MRRLLQRWLAVEYAAGLLALAELVAFLPVLIASRSDSPLLLYSLLAAGWGAVAAVLVAASWAVVRDLWSGRTG